MAAQVKVMQIIARMNVGGPAVIVAELMRGLDKNQFEQILVTGYCDENEADYLDTVAKDIKATRIAGLGRSVSLIADLKAFFGLVSLIRKYKPDVIHTHTAKAGVLGRLASLLAGRGAVRVHTFHGHLLHGYFSSALTKLVILIEKFFAARTSVLIAIGSKVKEDLLAAGIGRANKYRVFFPGLPAPKTGSKAAAQSALGISSEVLYCTFVGRLTQIKRPDRLLDVAAECKLRGIDLRFLVAGEGELFESSKQRALKDQLNVTFFGWRSDIDQIFASSDIAILTSDNEGIPLTLIQAAQAGLPIVATNVGSISDIVINESTGYLTSTTATEMADAIEKLVRDPQLRQMMGAAGKAHAERYFSLDRMIKDHSDLYRSL
ncbi:glycosyltransferase [Candidatus Planktophila lacus]|uniref:glycosyltransferase n=1 Tax=Candidatus Planktophila lacus TaxID=1884913 RepID=UPI000BAC8723|nr:glycosyltransferase [Candidatus Planktophila lacus]ASY25824.1 glycosyltransferase [Candidatus Planktophila lacus]